MKTSYIIYALLFAICFIGGNATFSHCSEPLQTPNGISSAPPLPKEGIRGDTSPFDAIIKTYAGVNTLEARFQQKIYIAALKKERQFDGEFFYKRHKGFLWRYRTPKVKYFLYDGTYMWEGDEEKSFVAKEKINKEKTGGTFLDLIEDISKMDELFALKQHSMSGNMEILELVPKRDGTINSAKIWVDKANTVRRIEVREFTDNLNTMEFSSVKINQNMDDTKFIYKPDKRKEVIER